MIKRLSLASALCFVIVFAISHPAFADETMCGNALIKYIESSESLDTNDVPVNSSIVDLEFTTPNKQIYNFRASAFGTQLSHALLKAFNYCERVNLCIRYKLDPFEVEIVSIGAGAYPRRDADCDGIGDECDGEVDLTDADCDGIIDGCDDFIDPTDAACDDGDLCTNDSCDPATGCTHEQIPGCCDEDADCPPDEPCTDNFCDLVNNACDSSPIPGCCDEDADCPDDGDLCTDEKCDLLTLTCFSTTIPDCDDPPAGACCNGDGLCDEMTQAECAGDYQGDGTNCVTAGCEHLALGACCFPFDGSCEDGYTESDCIADGGYFEGDGVDCLQTACDS